MFVGIHAIYFHTLALCSRQPEAALSHCDFVNARHRRDRLPDRVVSLAGIPVPVSNHVGEWVSLTHAGCARRRVLCDSSRGVQQPSGRSCDPPTVAVVGRFYWHWTFSFRAYAEPPHRDEASRRTGMRDETAPGRGGATSPIGGEQSRGDHHY